MMALLVGTLPTEPGCGLVGNDALGVAPVPDLGEGLGWWGCETVSPPVYLSETEAISVVRDELQAAGLEGRPENDERPGWVRLHDMEADGCGNVETSAYGTYRFKADLLWEKAGFAVEIITESNWDPIQTESYCDGYSVGYSDLRELARATAAELRERGGDYWYGVLYDPVSEGCGYYHHHDYGSECEEDGIETSKAILREQVAYLVEWMRLKGIL